MKAKSNNTNTKRRVIHKYSLHELTRKLDIKDSEELFNIEKEIPFQCPKIDSFIEYVKLFEQHLKRLDTLVYNNDEDKSNNKYIDIEMDILNKYQKLLEDSFEELRHSCESLRKRGNEWKILAQNMFDNVPNNIEFIDSKFHDKLKYKNE